jgi:hypothetical protein
LFFQDLRLDILIMSERWTAKDKMATSLKQIPCSVFYRLQDLDCEYAK